MSENFITIDRIKTPRSLKMYRCNTCAELTPLSSQCFKCSKYACEACHSTIGAKKGMHLIWCCLGCLPSYEASGRWEVKDRAPNFDEETWTCQICDATMMKEAIGFKCDHPDHPKLVCFACCDNMIIAEDLRESCETN